MTIEKAADTVYVSVAVQFSGKPQAYNYFASQDLADILKVGMKVIVPNNLKDDGTLSLTIATVVEVHDDLKPDAVKPVVDYIHTDWLEWATAVMKDRAKVDA